MADNEQMLCLWCVPLLILLCLLPWGPGHHLEYCERLYRNRREVLARPMALLIHEQRAAWWYGAIAADIINFKAFGGHYNHCHRWTIIDDMRAHARSAAEEAFIFGYLSHLAADTIAHNHFVPYHLARYSRGRQLGHLYWELNADRFVPEARWALITELKRSEELEALDSLVNATVPQRLFSMGTNKLIFNHVLLSSEREAWRRSLERLHPIGSVCLELAFLERFRAASMERVVLALRPGGLELLLHIDTNGKEAQKAALATRARLLDQLLLSREALEAEAQGAAAPFLEGMQSPPEAQGEPHWRRVGS